MFQEISGNIFNYSDTTACSCLGVCSAQCVSGCGGDYPRIEIRLAERADILAEIKVEPV